MGDRLGIHSAVDILYSNLLLIVPNTVRLWWHNTTWYIPLKIQCKSITIRLSSALNKDRLCYIDTTHPVTHLLKKVNQAYMLGRLDKWCSESISQRIKDKVSALAEISCKKIYQQENIHILTFPPPQLGESGYLLSSRLQHCLFVGLHSMSTAISPWIHQFSSDHCS